MNIVITAGGTIEPIDDVRAITNSSSGKLGSIIANKLVNLPQVENIFYVCSKNSIKPKNNKKITIIHVKTVENLLNSLKKLIFTQKIDVVIHSMAVSDYKVDYVSTAQNFALNLSNKNADEIVQTINNNKNFAIKQNKISSYHNNLIIKLSQTPKVISHIKQWDKNIFLVGFKLLSNVKKQELINVAKNLMIKNSCDMVVANDIKYISQKNHKAQIITRDKIFEVQTKQQIANKLKSIINEIY